MLNAARRLLRPGFMLPVGAAALAAVAGCATEGEGRLAGPSSHSEQGTVTSLGLVAAPALTAQANTFESSVQAHAALDRDAAGRTIVVWDSRRQQEGTPGVYAQVFGPDGGRLGGEIEVNLHAASAQVEPAVTWASDGAAWVVWASHGQDGSGMAVVLRRFAADFASGSPEIAVNSTHDGHQATPVIAAGPGGTVLVTWTSSRSTEPTRLMARVFGPDGMPLTPEREIEPSLNVRQTAPTITALPPGGGAAFLLAWAESSHETGAPLGVRVLKLDAAAKPVGEALAIGPTDGEAGIEPSIASDATGRFVVAWMVRDGERYRPMAQWFDRHGAPASPAVTIGERDESFKSGIAAAMEPDGTTRFAYNADAAEEELDLRAPENRERVMLAKYEFGGLTGGDVQPAHGFAKPGQRVSVSGVKRMVSASSEEIALAWSGDAGNADASAANLTLVGVVQAGDTQGAPTGFRQPEIAMADPTHTPPSFDPEFKAPMEPWPRQRGEMPAVDFGFEAVPGTGWTPPDPEMAVGPDHIVVMVNGQIAFFDKSGTNLFRDEIESNFGFWGGLGAGGFVFDPECLYDPHSNRFMAMACERTSGRSFFLFAVSDDSNPVGVWHKYRFDVTDRNPGGDTLNDIDSPQLGVDQNVVYLSADFFSPDKYLVFMVDKATVLTGGASPTVRSLVVTGQQSFGFPITYDAGTTAQYIIESFEASTNTSMRFHAIKDPLTTPTRTTTTLTVPTYRYPQPPVQQGSSTRPTVFEPRFWSCTYRNGSLWAVHHMTNTTSSVTRARWYQFDMRGWPDSGNTPILVQTGDVAPGTNVYVTFPSIAVDAANNAAITFSRSASNEFFSMSRVVRAYNDPAGTMRAPELVKQSAAPENSGRWGDYSGTKNDPTGCGVFWGHNEWTPNGNWRTWVAKYVIPNPADFNGDGFVNGIDFDLYVEAYELGLPSADFDQDGFVTGIDFDQYVIAFEAAC